MTTPDFTATRWRKSSRSNGEQACVELAFLADAVGVRDSKAPAGGHVVIGLPAFAGFVTRVKNGDFDRQG